MNPPPGRSIVDVVEERAEAHPGKIAFSFARSNDGQLVDLSFANMASSARQVAQLLLALGADAGDRAMLLYPPGLDFVVGYLGCLYAGVIAVPAPLPHRRGRDTRLALMAADCAPRFLLTAGTTLTADGLKRVPDLASLIMVRTDFDVVSGPVPSDRSLVSVLSSDTVAMLQYTSGSTSEPKGVVVTHGNLMANLEMAARCFDLSPSDTGVSWLPHYHDMGLIGGILMPIYSGFRAVLLSPVSFVQKPSRWLQLISEQGGTISAAPSFGYRLATERISDQLVAELDLSRWTRALNGAEPVSADVQSAFAARFAGCGFRAGGFRPCYGLAEATLLVTGRHSGQGPRVLAVDADELNSGFLRQASGGPGEPTSRKLVSSGRAVDGVDVAIVDPVTLARVPDGAVGEILVRGDHVATGYWRAAGPTQATFAVTISGEDPRAYLRTGDLGALLDGELFVTGRKSDLMIFRGRNHYPQDIEATVASSDGMLASGVGAAFSVDEDGEEVLVVVHEAPRRGVPDGLLAAIVEQIAEQHELVPADVVLVKPGTLPLTSSGKIRRRACRDSFLRGQLSEVARWRATSHRTRTQPEPSRSGAYQVGSAALRAWLTAQIAEAAGIEPAAVQTDLPFSSFGLDSVKAVELSGRLEDYLDRPVDPTLIWDYPTIEAVVAHLIADTASLAARADPVISTTPAAEPIAIIGIGCRFPGGVDGPDSYWSRMIDGFSAAAPMRRARWERSFVDPAEITTVEPDERVRAAVGFAALLDDVAGFDAELFGITAREAADMDPQQRLLLEVAWEALEQSGRAPDSLADTRTGVFVGLSSNDYRQILLRTGQEFSAGPHAGTGNALSIAANRVSYVLGLVGPSVTVDTACSSSLVSVHLACASLRAGECALALAGGANVILSPETTLNFARAGMLSPTGVCRTFDAEADGYVRGEGVGLVVLRRLSDAQAAGDHILAVIAGSAINQDGRSNGLTAPNGRSQKAVISDALRAASVRADDVGYVETHGTGTPMGDPIEMRALSSALGTAGRSQPLVVGSVKSSIGHLESAAGIAGLIKAALVVERGLIPPQANYANPNPLIDFGHLGLTVPTEIGPMHASSAGPRVAGVSSFGFGGTNAHVVLRQADPAPTGSGTRQIASRRHLIKVSAKSPAALAVAAGRLADHLASSSADLAAEAWAANVQRSDLETRAVVAGASRAELVAGLRSLQTTGRRSTGVTGPQTVVSRRPRTLFVVPGQGANVAGALAGIYAEVPAVTTVIDCLASELGPVTSGPLGLLIQPSAGATSVPTELSQPAIYALALALGRWWESLGIAPDALLGHSVGAYAAAALAGVFSEEEGARLVARRGQLMAGLARGGAMLAVRLPEAQVQEFACGGVVVGAVNSPSQTVLSGPRRALAQVASRLQSSGIGVTWLAVNHGFHSPLVEPMIDEFTRAARSVTYRAPRVPLISDSLGTLAGAEIASAAYWVEHCRRPTLFYQALLAASTTAPVEAVVQLGPGRSLLAFAREALGDAPALIATLDPRSGGADDHSGASGRAALDRALADGWTSGLPVNWQKIGPRPIGPLPQIPSYPFQHRSHWISALQPSPRPPRPDPADDTTDVEPLPELAASLLVLPEPDRKPALVSRLQHEIAIAVGAVDPHSVDPDASLFDLGVDSLLVLELRRKLSLALGRALPATMAIDHPSINAIASFLLEADVIDGVTSPHFSSVPTTAPADGDPIAIVGMGCRFPGGADSPAQFWELLQRGIDASSEVPAGRWDVDAFYDPDPDAPGRSYTKRGSFLTGPVDGFDATMFGLSPREAASMDPQQRLLLEVAWEALEDAGIPIEELAGSRTGVFVGINSADYLQLLAADGLSCVDAYVATGNTSSVAAGRLSYLLGLRGPAIALDTACSSSLVAVHLALQSLRSGESDLAVVGGVNLQLSPATTIGLAKLQALAPDGRCKAFDASADGYGRGEGCGVVVLQRESAAAKRGARIWARLRGSAVNQDGRSAGLTVPNGPVQTQLIADALASAGVMGGDIDYVEAHGTGTPLGDPIEVQAMAAVLGQGRPSDHPLLIGSVKTNIGHLEAAAGIAGVIKVALSLHHQAIPAQLHFREPNPYVPWDELPVRVVTEGRLWTDEPDRVRRAGVSSFGFSGTNSHVVLESAPAAAPVDGPTDGADLMLLSARTEAALRDLASSTASLLRARPEAWRDLCSDAAVHRSHHRSRLAAVATKPQDAANALEEYARGASSAVRAGRVDPSTPPRLIWVFGGHGAEWAGMGKELLAEADFAAVVERCDTVFAEAGLSAGLLMNGPTTPDLLEDTAVIQPVLYAYQCAIAALLRRWGVSPDAVVGHSVGEIAAAQVSGAISLEDGARIALHRGRAMQPAKGQGRMAVVGLGPADVVSRLPDWGTQLAVAAHNSPRATVISGPVHEVTDAVSRVVEAGGSARMLAGSLYPFHSPAMAGPASELKEALNGVSSAAPEIPMWSTVTGRAVSAGDLNAGHWAKGVVGQVRFCEALGAAARELPVVALEVGPSAVLAASIVQTLEARGPVLAVVATASREKDTAADVLESVASLHVHGVAIDHARRVSQHGLRRVGSIGLPTYPWQRDRFWLPGRAPADGDKRGRDVASPQNAVTLQRRFDTAAPVAAHYFETDLDDERLAGAWGSRYSGAEVVSPGLALELLLAAGEETLVGGGNVSAVDVELHEPLLASPGAAARIQVVVTDEPSDRAEVWLLGDHLQPRRWVSARLRCVGDLPVVRRPHEPTLEPAPADFVDAAGWVLPDRVAIESVSVRTDGHIAAAVTVDSPGEPGARAALFEAAFVLAASSMADRGGWLRSIGGARVCHLAGGPLNLRLDRHDRARPDDSDRAESHWSLEVTDVEGRLVAAADDVCLSPMSSQEADLHLRPVLASLAYDIEWHPITSPPPPEPSGTWIVVAPVGDSTGWIESSLVAAGAHARVLPAEASPADLVSEVVAAGHDLAGLVLIATLDDHNDQPLTAEHLLTCSSATSAALIQAIRVMEECAPADARVFVVTRGAQPPGDGPSSLRLCGAAIWGAARAVTLEHPDRFGTVIDLDTTSADERADASAVLGELCSADFEEQVAYRAGQRLAPRLVARPDFAGDRDDTATPPGPRLDPEATYMITGGRGSLGRAVAEWLADRGARHLVLVGRTPLPARAEWESEALPADVRPVIATVRRLESAGVDVSTPAADASDRDAMARLLDAIPDDRPIRGVVHAAGTFTLRSAVDTTTEDLVDMLMPKVHGAWTLYELTADLELDFFVMFSSAAAVWGSALAAGYAAANHVEDALAQFGRRQGRPTLAVNWGWWAGGGMASPELQKYFRSIGLGTLPRDVALTALGHLIARGEAAATVAPVDWSRFKPVFEARRRRHLLDRIEVDLGPGGAGDNQEAEGMLVRLSDMPPARRTALVAELLQEEVSGVLGLPTGRRVDPELGFFDMGMDSLMSVELQRRLKQRTGVTLPVTSLFERPCIAALAEYLVQDCLAPRNGQETSDGPIALDLEAASDGTKDLDGVDEAELLALLAAEVDDGGTVEP